MLFHVTMDKDEDGYMVAECPALPGCVSQGKDEQEALENIKEAISLILEVFREGEADAALAASIFHDSIQGLGELKRYLGEQGVSVRQTG